jgi:transposase
MRPYVKCVAVANSRMVRAIAHARVKTDKIDDAILACLRSRVSEVALPDMW